MLCATKSYYMKYVLTVFACFIFISSFAQMLMADPADTFAYKTITYLEQIDSSVLPQTEKNELEFQKMKQYISKRPNDVWIGQQLLWFNKYIDAEKLDTLFNLFDTSVQNQIAQVYIPVKIRSKLVPGKSFPEMILVDSLKHSLRIADLKGKIIFIDIWASWCVPCRAEMPKLISLYEKYKNKGFVVIAVSLDDNKEKWLKAIRDDSLPWIHFCELVDVENNIFGKKWGINSIPYNFLIDKDGILVDKQVSTDILEGKLLKLL